MLRGRLVCIFFVLVGLFSIAHAQSESGAIDHVRILVHSFDGARAQYRDKLGFDLPNPPLIFDEGSAHDAMWFAGRAYLELIGVVDREKLLQSRPWIVNFLDHTEGMQSVGLSVPSVAKVADRLRARGIEAEISRIAPKAGQPPFQHIVPKLPNFPAEALFFTEYPPRTQAQKPPKPVHHPNSAEGIASVWIVVQDLDKASADLDAIGFRRLRRFRSKTLGAVGQEFATDRGSLLLMHASGAGPVAAFTKERGQGVMGVSLRVSDLSRAEQQLESRTGRRSKSYRGFYGPSFLIPADLAAGAWIEMVQTTK